MEVHKRKEKEDRAQRLGSIFGKVVRSSVKDAPAAIERRRSEQIEIFLQTSFRRRMLTLHLDQRCLYIMEPRYRTRHQHCCTSLPVVMAPVFPAGASGPPLTCYKAPSCADWEKCCGSLPLCCHLTFQRSRLAVMRLLPFLLARIYGLRS